QPSHYQTCCTASNKKHRRNGGAIKYLSGNHDNKQQNHNNLDGTLYADRRQEPDQRPQSASQSLVQTLPIDQQFAKHGTDKWARKNPDHRYDKWSDQDSDGTSPQTGLSAAILFHAYRVRQEVSSEKQDDEQDLGQPEPPGQLSK